MGDPSVLETWKRLWEWVQSSRHNWRRSHELQKVQNPLGPDEDLVLHLYLPIENRA
jgi:hypothetical protein